MSWIPTLETSVRSTKCQINGHIVLHASDLHALRKLSKNMRYLSIYLYIFPIHSSKCYNLVNRSFTTLFKFIPNYYTVLKEELIFLKCPYYPIMINRFYAISIKIPMTFSQKWEKKSVSNHWKNMDSQSNLEKDQSWRHHISWFQTILKAIVIKTLS